MTRPPLISPASPAAPATKPWHVVAAGLVALGVAMGIGRFAFTPILPMMLADGVVDLPQASWLASANYLGYLAGALLCMLQPWLWRKLGNPPPLRLQAWVRGGLAATCLLTLAMVPHLPAAWPALRFGAGVASAFVFIYTSGWCLAQLSQLGVPALAALIYTGPGMGIIISGLAASGMMAQGRTAAAAWLAFGLLAAVLTAIVWPAFRSRTQAAPAATNSAAASAGATPEAAEPAAAHGRTEVALLTLAYGLAGFGYIITATFLPVIARQALPGSAWIDRFWPIFGLGVILGALSASRLRITLDRRLLLVGGYLVQALGIAAGLASPSEAGFAIGSLLLGIPFTIIPFFAMQEARRLRPTQAASTMGLLTAVYGIGQIVGPPLATALLARSRSAGDGFTLSLELAAAALVAGAVLHGAMMRRYPLSRR